MLKRFLKSSKGFTLVELLAVIVILGIIAGIAVPSIGGIIDNTKKDAHIANARQAIAATKLAMAAESDLAPTSGNAVYINITYLEDNGYLETLVDPDGGEYVKATAAVGNGTTEPTSDSYVLVSNDGDSQFTYSVYLDGNDRDVEDTDTADDPATELSLSRESVVDDE